MIHYSSVIARALTTCFTGKLYFSSFKTTKQDFIHIGSKLSRQDGKRCVIFLIYTSSTEITTKFGKREGLIAYSFILRGV